MPVCCSNSSATLSERPTSEEYQTTVPSRFAACSLSAATSNAFAGLLSARAKAKAASAAAPVLMNCLPRCDIRISRLVSVGACALPCRLSDRHGHTTGIAPGREEHAVIAGAAGDQNFDVLRAIGNGDLARVIRPGEIFLPPAFHQGDGFGIEDIDRDLRAFEHD